MPDREGKKNGEPSAATTDDAAETTDEAAETPLIDRMLRDTLDYDEADEGYDKAGGGLEAALREIARRGALDEGKPDLDAIDKMIAELDKNISGQVDEVLHSEGFQKIESAWRGLKFLVDRTDFRENLEIDIMQVTKEELIEDFEDTPEVVKSGLYHHVYSQEYGVFGGKPYGAMVANYEFGIGGRELELLSNCASVAAMAHAPFLTAASPKVFGSSKSDFTSIQHEKRDLKDVFRDDRYAKWNSFRASDDARAVGLTLPRFLLRAPYEAEEGGVKSFAYEEDVSDSHDRYLWGNTAFALASRISDSFAKYRWCPNIIGPQSGGAVEELPLHHYEAMGSTQTKIPTEVLITGRREFELAEEGFIALTMRKGSDNAAFFSANSAQKAKTFGKTPEQKEQETSWRLGTQLPYLFIVNRLAHYLKVQQWENIGNDKAREDLEKELNGWVGQYVLDMKTSDKKTLREHPLLSAKITVADVPGNPGWYQTELKVKPRIKFMGGNYTLSLVGKLDSDRK